VVCDWEGDCPNGPNRMNPAAVTTNTTITIPTTAAARTFLASVILLVAKLRNNAAC
jgi:hypothetical protein